MTISRRSEIANPQQDHSRHASSRARTTLAVLLLALTLSAPEREARAQTGGPPPFLPYQARLLDSTGTPVSGMMNVAFAFYDVPIGGIAILTDMQTVSVTNGLASTKVPLTVDITESHKPLFLGVRWGGDPEMVPRIELGSVPYVLTGGGGSNSVPPGTILMTGALAAPPGYLMCDGQEVMRTDYPDLFTAIQTTYGVGDGTTTFNLPDLRQRFPMHRGPSGTGSVLGESGGQLNHTHAVPNHTHAMAHAHSVPAHAHSLPGHDHSIPTHMHVVPGHWHTVDELSINKEMIENSESLAGGKPALGKANSGTLKDVVITKDGNVGRLSTNVLGDNDFNSGPSPSGQKTGTGGTGSTGSGGSGNTSTFSGTTGLDGGGQTASANPPYLTLHFMIKT